MPPSHTPWLKQYFEDMTSFEGFDEMEEVAQDLKVRYVEHGDHCVRHLLTDEESRESFCRFDSKQLKVASYLPDIPRIKQQNM
eukprot:5201831-Karenia_brevis.AAC.1